MCGRFDNTVVIDANPHCNFSTYIVPLVSCTLLWRKNGSATVCNAMQDASKSASWKESRDISLDTLTTFYSYQ